MNRGRVNKIEQEEKHHQIVNVKLYFYPPVDTEKSSCTSFDSTRSMKWHICLNRPRYKAPSCVLVVIRSSHPSRMCNVLARTVETVYKDLCDSGVELNKSIV